MFKKRSTEKKKEVTTKDCTRRFCDNLCYIPRHDTKKRRRKDCEKQEFYIKNKRGNKRRIERRVTYKKGQEQKQSLEGKSKGIGEGGRGRDDIAECVEIDVMEVLGGYNKWGVLEDPRCYARYAVCGEVVGPPQTKTARKQRTIRKEQTKDKREREKGIEEKECGEERERRRKDKEKYKNKKRKNKGREETRQARIEYERRNKKEEVIKKEIEEEQNS
uniref:Uncharacterized protein n=1 Tax=Heliothis virescens TaxID=7102 RepID=A0A2A4JP47_HELVI